VSDGRERGAFEAERTFLPTVAKALLVGVAYYVSGYLALRLALVAENVTPLWPPSGIAVVGFLVFGRRIWPGVAVAAFLLNLPISTTPLAAAATAAGNTVAPLVAAALLRRVGFRRQIDRLRDAVAIVILGALGAMTISATVGSAALVWSGAIPAAEFPGAWAVWWAGDAMGVLVVAPFLLTFRLSRPSGPVPWRRALEAVALLCLTGGLASALFWAPLQLKFLILPVIAWAAWRFQQRVATPAALLVVGIASWSAAEGAPSFSSGRSLLEDMLTLQAFNATVAFSALFLAALVADRIRARQGLERSATELQRRVHERTEELTREHWIAETLQRSLLPDRLPEIPGVDLAARYVPAAAGLEIGGDWYDVVELPSGRVALAVGDVAGHGLRAAGAMGQLRLALRAYAIEEPSPAVAVARTHRLFQRLGSTDMATLVYLEFDPGEGTVRFANAGHPPPLVLLPDGTTSYLEGGLAPPLGAIPTGMRFRESSSALPPGATLLLFTDGLVERRGSSLHEDLDRLREVLAGAPHDLDELCDHLLATYVSDDLTDDVALLALRPLPLAGMLRLRIPADPHELQGIRRALRRWLRELDAPAALTQDFLVACGEAATNAIQHAYGAGVGSVDITAQHLNGSVEVIVSDSGTWRARAEGEGGRGIALIRGLMDRVDVETGSTGTVVRMRRWLRADT
jgi:serine phosphatase RsbU (regulator of sigma subunit)/integral membrane sensor domain MASE1/anti-sigma regulatory factor (Ser/Thr protein kinase)